jgi:hypothetical protein
MPSLPIIRDAHGRRFSVTTTPAGWVVREEHEDRIVRDVTYRDWHRVERAVANFERQFQDDEPPHFS